MKKQFPSEKTLEKRRQLLKEQLFGKDPDLVKHHSAPTPRASSNTYSFAKKSLETAPLGKSKVVSDTGYLRGDLGKILILAVLAISSQLAAKFLLKI